MRMCGTRMSSSFASACWKVSCTMPKRSPRFRLSIAAAASRWNFIEQVGEADRLEQGDDARAGEHRRDLGQDGAERGGARLGVRVADIDAGNEADGLRAGGIRRLDQGGHGGAALGVPVVEGIDLAQSEEAQAALARHLGRASGGDAVEERAAEVVARLDADAAEVRGEVEEGGEVEARRRLLVQGEIHRVILSLATLRRRAS